MSRPPVILASNSPRRRELLRLIFSRFEVMASRADETLPPDTPPARAVEELALRKARAVEAPADALSCRASIDALVIGADTVVVLDGVILGKPADEAEARAMLRALSGRTHLVYTGVALVRGGEATAFHEATEVSFRALGEAEIAAYAATGEPMDKAGAYGIQGRAALFVTGIRGDYYNVVGLPVCALSQKIPAFAPEFGRI